MRHLPKFSIAVALALLAVSPGLSQDKDIADLKKELAALRAEVKALHEKIAKLTGSDGQLLPTIPEHEKKWVRSLVTEFMTEMLKPRGRFTFGDDWYAAPRKLVAKGVEFSHMAKDPNVSVSQQGKGFREYMGPRRVALEYVFDRFEIASEEVAPSKDELLLQGALQGKKAELSPNENYAQNFAGDSLKTTIVAGELGPRAGKFSMRVAREKESNRWLISYFTWTVDELKKAPEQK